MLYSCGIAIEDFTEDDDPSAREFHRPTCEFYTGIPSRNRPIGERSGEDCYLTYDIDRVLNMGCLFHVF